MNNITTENKKGTFNVQLDNRTRITLRCTEPYALSHQIDGQEHPTVLAPDTVDSRYYQGIHDGGSKLTITTNGYTTIVTKELAPRDEHPSPDSLCEVVHEEKLSMYDRLKAEMFQAISQYAEDKGLDTFEDDDDHEFMDDADDNLIDTPYEYQAMQEDTLNAAPIPEPIPQPMEIPSELVEPTTPTEPTPAS